MHTEGAPTPARQLLQLSTLAHTETVGFEEFGNCEVAYEQCHKLLTDRCVIMTQRGGVARELTSNDWAKLRMMVLLPPFDSSKLAK